MNTKTLLTMFLLSIATIIVSCKQESTQVVVPQAQWVEITDTTHLSNIWWLSSVYSTWNHFTGLTLRDTAEYQALTTMIDTSDVVFKRRDTIKYPVKLPVTPDFSKYSMIGLSYFGYFQDTLRTSLYINDDLKQYQYYVWCTNPYGNKYGLTAYQNWLQVPKLKQGYTVIFYDTIPPYINNN